MGRAGEILNEHKFSGNLYTILYQLDTFVNTTITNRRPIPISALREDTVLDYPYWATRELLMNAICHRDYESNGPVLFYQYDDRIELLNPGGLYGKARPENFPWVNDYRNSVVAEALKVMGFVIRRHHALTSIRKKTSLAPATLKGTTNHPIDNDNGFCYARHVGNPAGKRR